MVPVLIEEVSEVHYRATVVASMIRWPWSLPHTLCHLVLPWSLNCDCEAKGEPKNYSYSATR